MLTYIGNRDTGYWVEEAAHKYKLDFRSVDSANHLSSQIKDILEVPSKYLVFDLGQYIDTAQTFARDVKKIGKASNATLIMVLNGSFHPQSAIVEALRKEGVRLFVESDLPGEKKIELDNILASFENAKSGSFDALDTDTSEKQENFPSPLSYGGHFEYDSDDESKGDTEELPDVTEENIIWRKPERTYDSELDELRTRIDKQGDEMALLIQMMGEMQKSLSEANMKRGEEPCERADQIKRNQTPLAFYGNKAIEQAIAMEKYEDHNRANMLKAKERRGKKISVGIAGSQHRIGTTTQALQLVKYLMLHDKKACYIEMNRNGMCQAVRNVYDCSEKPEIGCVSYAGVDMFYDTTMLSEIKRQDYTYFIYDYGVVGEKDFNRDSFLEKDIRVFVLGSFVTEYQSAKNVIRNTIYQDVEYIFSFTPNNERRDLMTQLGSKSEFAHFAGYAPDPFVLSDAKAYESLLPILEERDERRRKVFSGMGRSRK